MAVSRVREGVMKYVWLPGLAIALGLLGYLAGLETTLWGILVAVIVAALIMLGLAGADMVDNRWR